MGILSIVDNQRFKKWPPQHVYTNKVLVYPQILKITLKFISMKKGGQSSIYQI